MCLEDRSSRSCLGTAKDNSRRKAENREVLLLVRII